MPTDAQIAEIRSRRNPLITDIGREAALIAGFDGTVEYRYQLLKSDKLGNEGDPLPNVTAANVSMNNFRDNTWELSASMERNEAFDPRDDYAKLIIWVRDPYVKSGTNPGWRRYPYGLYRFTYPGETFDPSGQRWEVTGQSLEILLLGNSAYKGYKVNAGVGVLAACKTILSQRAGIPSSRVVFPSPDVPLSRPFFADPVQDFSLTYYLRICNSLLNAGGFSALFTDGEGRFTCRELEATGDREEAVFYGNEPGSEAMIIGEVSGEYEADEFANRVIVRSGDSIDSPPLVAAAELRSKTPVPAEAGVLYVIDPDSPASIDALGYVEQRDPIDIQNVVSLSEAQKIARRQLVISAGVSHKLQLATMFDPRRKPRELYKLSLLDWSGRRMIGGRWGVVGVESSLDEQTMNHELSRREPA